MDKIIDMIEQHWLEWESVPFVFAILLVCFVSLASEVNDWIGVVIEGWDYLLLAIPFLIALIAYMICCVVHNRKEEKARIAVANGESTEEVAEEAPPAKKRAWLIAGIVLSVVAIVFAVFAFIGNSGMGDGEYVIWSQKYNVSLTPEVIKNYYLAGDTVRPDNDGLADYSDRSVVRLDFESDGTFAIYVEGEKLGVVPDQNGVGYRADCTNNVWVLEEAGEGVYYIKNVTGETYLKWFVTKNNWTTHPNITADNEDQYLICLTPVK